MDAYIRHAAILIAGWGFILLGVAGLLLPILPGVLFVLLGLAILSTEYAWAHRWLTSLGARFPKVHRAAERARREISRRWQRLSRQRPPN